MKLLLSLILVFAFASLGAAQTVNPTTVTVPASADHNTTVGTAPVLTGYNVFLVKQSAPTVRLDTKTIGKPNLDTANAGFLVPVPIPPSFLSQKNVPLQIGYEAFGPGGSAAATVLSDPFAFLGAPAVSASLKPTVQ